MNTIALIALILITWAAAAALMPLTFNKSTIWPLVAVLSLGVSGSLAALALS